tara:strand:+ start:316 stop:1743 length:1428 start_codon:yes stop_codon:yes gene_type:complete
MGSGSSSPPPPKPDKRTHNYSDITNGEARERNTRNQFNTFYKSVLTLLKQRKNYMDAKSYSTYMTQLTSLANGLPNYITDVEAHHYWIWRVFTAWTYNINYEFFNQMSARTKSVTNIKNSINALTETNCENEYSMLPVASSSVGSADCGMVNTALNFSNGLLPIKTVSNNIVANLSPSAPQKKTATAVDTTLNNYYGWNYKNTPNKDDPSYANLSKYSILNTYKLMGENIASVYNDCSNNSTLISISPENQLPYCISDKYANAQDTCKSVITQAGPNGYNYPKGYDQLNELWTKVSEAIPGNTLTAGNAILDSAQNSCNKWQDMFNAWQEAEAKAVNTPCRPERPIQPTYDPVMLNMAQQWNQSATLYIESLMKRLEIIQKYIETYPNILQLEESGVTLGPSSLGGSMLLQYKVDQMTPGVAPVQYLTMLVPNGPDGEQGEMGEKGIPGFNGSSVNSQGPTGPTGNPKLPTIFDR